MDMVVDQEDRRTTGEVRRETSPGVISEYFTRNNFENSGGRIRTWGPSLLRMGHFDTRKLSGSESR